MIDYEYDALYRLTSAEYSTGDYYHYTYDEVGNRLTEETHLESNTYVYDDANRLASVNTVNYTFDDNGNLLDDGVNTYTYDSANRLTTVSGQSSTVNYAYNGFGDRLSQTVDSVTTNYTLDLNSGLTQVLDDGENIYTYGLGRISQTHVTTEYFLGDALGSVRQLTDSTGEITLAKGYDPYGVVTYTTGASQTEYGFTGEQYSVETQMLYLRARYYNPADARFMSRDTWNGIVKRPLSLNRWNYVEGNPINLTDPTGHCVNPDGSITWWKWPWFNWGPCPSDTSVPSTSTPSPTSTSTPTCTPTVPPTPMPMPTFTIFFGGSDGQNLANAHDPYIDTAMWANSATKVVPFPGGVNGVGKQKQANSVDINIYKDSNLILIGYSAGGDAALIFADKYRKYQETNKGTGMITDIAILGGTMSGKMTDTGTLEGTWRDVLNNLLVWGTDIYILNDDAWYGNEASGYIAPAGASGTFFYDDRGLTQSHVNGTNNSVSYKNEVFSWFSAH